jgi:predicted Zn-dependent protease
MSSHRSLALAVATGLATGGIVYQFLLTDWFFALGVTATYAGVAYFYVAFDVPLSGQYIQFTRRHDKLGHAIGIFGLSISPLALISYAKFQQPEAIGVLVWTTGVIAFLLFASIAHDQEWAAT